jgi:hypothetical protein
MKVKTLFKISILLLLCNPAKSQLVYDYSKAEFVNNDAYDGQKKKVLPARNGGFMWLKIININTFRCKVELEGNSVNYVTPVPSELQSIFRLNADNIDDKNIVNALRITKGASNLMQEEADQAKKNATIIAAKVPPGPAALVGLGLIKKNTSDAADKLKEAMSKLAKACSSYVEIAKKVANIKFRRMQLIDLSKQKWKSHSQLKSNLPAQLSESQMKKDYDLFTEYYATAYSLYTTAGNAADEAVKQNVPGSEATKEAIAKAEEQIEEGRELFYQDNFIKLISDVVILQTALEKEEYFAVESAPIQIDGDFVKLKAKIEPAQINDPLPYDFVKDFQVEIPVKGGLKVDFGVGPTVSFGASSKDEVYYFEPTSGDNGTLRQRPNNNVVSPAIGAFMAFGPRSGKEVRIGGLFGLGAGFQSSSNVNFNLYGGLSAVFGKRERIMLGTGVGYLRVSRLKDKEFVVGTEYPVISAVTEKVYKPSFFLTLTYNLTNRIEVK